MFYRTLNHAEWRGFWRRHLHNGAVDRLGLFQVELLTCHLRLPQASPSSAGKPECAHSSDAQLSARPLVCDTSPGPAAAHPRAAPTVPRCDSVGIPTPHVPRLFSFHLQLLQQILDRFILRVTAATRTGHCALVVHVESAFLDGNPGVVPLDRCMDVWFAHALSPKTTVLRIMSAKFCVHVLHRLIHSTRIA